MRKVRGGRLPSPGAGWRDAHARRDAGKSRTDTRPPQAREEKRKARDNGRRTFREVRTRRGSAQLPAGVRKAQLRRPAGKSGRRRARPGPVQTAAGMSENAAGARRGTRKARPAGDGPLEHRHRERDAPPAGRRPPRAGTSASPARGAGRSLPPPGSGSGRAPLPVLRHAGRQKKDGRGSPAVPGIMAACRCVPPGPGWCWRRPWSGCSA